MPFYQENMEALVCAMNKWLEENTILKTSLSTKAGKVEFAKYFLLPQMEQLKQRCAPHLRSFDFLLDSSPCISLRGPTLSFSFLLYSLPDQKSFAFSSHKPILLLMLFPIHDVWEQFISRCFFTPWGKETPRRIIP